jgi:hypothetical protein
LASRKTPPYFGMSDSDAGTPLGWLAASCGTAFGSGAVGAGSGSEAAAAGAGATDWAGSSAWSGAVGDGPLEHASAPARSRYARTKHPRRPVETPCYLHPAHSSCLLLSMSPGGFSAEGTACGAYASGPRWWCQAL